MSSEHQPAGPKPTAPPAVGQQSAQLDWLSDFVIPAAVFGLLGTLLYFLIDLRQYLVGGEAAILRYVVFWFLIGVIGLARLSARPNASSTPPVVYAAALAAVVGWVTVVLTQFEGPWAAAGRYRSPGLSILLNLATVAGIWAAAWFLTGTCTRPERALEELRSGGVAAAEGYRSAVAAPLRAVLIVTGLAVAIFGYGLAAVNPTSELHAHAFVCAALFLLFALLLMALVTLGAARLAAHEGRLRIRGRVVGAWVAGAATVAAAAIVGALVLPEVASRLKPKPQGMLYSHVADEQAGRGLGTRQAASSWVDRVPGGARRLVERMMRGNRRRPGVPPKPGEGRGSVRPMPVPRPVGRRPPSWLLWLFVALLVLAALYRLRRRIVALLRAAVLAVARVLAAVAAFFKRLVGRKEHQAGQLPADPWADIFAAGPVSAVDPAMAVRHLWRALQLYYQAVGAGRREQETEAEFARRVPASFSIVPDDVRRVAMLYCAVEYGGVRLRPEVAEQMRELWRRLSASAQVARQASKAKAS